MATYFRQLGPEHTPLLTECLVRWHRAEGRPLDPRRTGGDVARILADNQAWHVWLIEDQESVVGYLALNFRPGAAYQAARAYVAGLYVTPGHRHRGLGRRAGRLVNELGRWLQVQIFDFETSGEAKHALALTRHVLPVRTDSIPWQATA